MSRRDELYERYEDAFFALLMEDLVEEEGKKLLEENERLRNDPDAAVSDRSYRRGLKTIQRAFGSERRRRAGKTAYRVINKIALLALISIFLFSTVFAASPAFRRESLNFLVNMTESSVDLTLVGADTFDGYILGGYIFPAPPDGYIIEEQTNNGQRLRMSYLNDSGGIIQLTVVLTQDVSLSMDSEGAQSVERIQIHGFDGLLVIKDGDMNIAYADTRHNAFIQLFCTDLDRDSALELIEKVAFLEK